LRRLVAIALLATAGCASRIPVRDAAAAVRPATDTPDHFVVGTPDSDETTEPGASPARECRSPMVDPRDRTRLRLVWSSGGQGEYEVLSGRYGVGSGEVLRLDCATGRAVGVATRRPG
jgi:hypothetical protein